MLEQENQQSQRKSSNMRYQVGQKYVFLHAPNAEMRTLIPVLHVLGVAPRVEVLTCVAHHRVPVSIGSRTKIDGYTFEDSAKAQWFNQYPQPYTADYLDRGTHVVTQKSDEESVVLEDAGSYIGRVLTGIELSSGKNQDRWEDFCQHVADITLALDEHGYQFSSKNVEVKYLDGSVKVFPTLFKVQVSPRLAALPVIA
jgi:hypothetical protein